MSDTMPVDALEQQILDNATSENSTTPILDATAMANILALVRTGYSITHAAKHLGIRLVDVNRCRREGRKSPGSPYAYFAGILDEAAMERSYRKDQEEYARRENARGNKSVTDMQKMVQEHVDSSNAFTLAHSFFTYETRYAILTSIKSGVYPHIASEQAGVPRNCFVLWLERGKEETRSEYRAFYMDYIAACAEARAIAEQRVYEDNPMGWLLHGPARERGDGLGWTKQSETKHTLSGEVSVINTHWGSASVSEELAKKAIGERETALIVDSGMDEEDETLPDDES